MADDAEQFPVYLGLWTNWSRGSVHGATLTLSRQNGALLVAFTAFFVAFTGTRLWRLASLIAHFRGTTSLPRDGIYHQRQAILRNAATPESALWTLIQIFWAWKSGPKRVWAKIVPLALFATLCGLGFFFASGFSSLTSTSSGDEVLLNGPSCVYLDGDLGATIDEQRSIWLPFVTKAWQSAATYAKQCYNQGTNEGYLKCGTFVQSSLKFTTNVNAPCPFAKDICKTQDQNIVLDSGLLDSNDHFGLNAPDNERIQWRKVVHCAPLRTNGYKTTFDGSIPGDTSAQLYGFSRYNYGPVRDTLGNITTYTAQQINGNFWQDRATSTGYTLASLYTYARNGTIRSDGWQPIPSLRRSDATVTIVFLSSNGLYYLNQTADLWFQASRSTATTTMYNVTIPIYKPAEAASPLACSEQEQFCADDGQRCTVLGSFGDIPARVDALARDDEEYFRIQWIHNVIHTPAQSLKLLIDRDKGSGLLANSHLTANLQGPLPDNQWQLETQNWFATDLANIQHTLVRSAIGTFDPGLQKLSKGPEVPVQAKLCANQKIKSTAYSSFSMLGLCLIGGIGITIILASYIVEPIIACLNRRKGYQNYAHIEWASNATLQLQRLAHQGVGAGTWAGMIDEVPTTQSGELLAVLEFEPVTEKKQCAVRLVKLQSQTSPSLAPMEAASPSLLDAEEQPDMEESTEVASQTTPATSIAVPRASTERNAEMRVSQDSHVSTAAPAPQSQPSPGQEAASREVPRISDEQHHTIATVATRQ